MKKCARLTALGVVPDAMSAAQLVRVVLPRRRGGFARMKSGVGLQRRCWTRRSFEPILNPRVPESDDPCAWPVADFVFAAGKPKGRRRAPTFYRWFRIELRTAKWTAPFFVEPHVPR